MDSGIFLLLVLCGIIAIVVLVSVSSSRAAKQAAFDNWRAQVGVLDELKLKLEANAIDQTTGLVLKRGEIIVGSIAASLQEYRSTGSSYVGGSQGFSFRIMKGVSYRVGSSRGQLVKNPEALTTLDSGTATFTNERIVFAGSSQAREWAFDKMVGSNLGYAGISAMISVSNRQKVSGLLGLGFDSPTPGVLLNVALGAQRDGVKGAVEAVDDMLAQFRADAPVDPSATKAALPAS
jgi:hypothetical protein